MAKNIAPVAAPVHHTQSSVYDLVRSKGLTMRTVRVNGVAQSYDVAAMRSKSVLASCKTYGDVVAFCGKYVPGGVALPTSAKVAKPATAPKAAKPASLRRKPATEATHADTAESIQPAIDATEFAPA